MAAFHTVLDPFEGYVEELNDVEQKRHERNHQHEDNKDGLLRGAGEETVHLVGARRTLASVHSGQAEAVDVPLEQQEAHLKDGLEKKW